MSQKEIKVILANPRGFCAGVERAIEIVERALKKYGSPVYVRHEIVHNKYVVDDLRNRGAVFVDDIAQVPSGSVIVFSAHGVSQKIEDESKLNGLNIVDATCPLVKKVHSEAQKYVSDGRKLILIGHKDHPEVEGTSGRVQQDKVFLIENLAQLEALNLQSDEKLSYVTQTTLSIDDTAGIVKELHEKYIDIKGPSLRDICYATQNRQNAVKNMAEHVDILIVIGAQNSSNSNRLKNLGEAYGIDSYLIDDAQQLDFAWFTNKNCIGITAGASAPEILLTQVLETLGKYYHIKLEEMPGVQENVKFKVPDALKIL